MGTIKRISGVFPVGEEILELGVNLFDDNKHIHISWVGLDQFQDL